MMRRTLVALSTMLILSAVSVLAESHRKFPGKGKVDDWNRAIEICTRGNQFSEKKDYKSAIESYKQAIAVYPYEALFYYNSGIAFMDSGQREKAVPQLQKAVEIEPGYFKAWFNLGSVNLDLNRRQDAVKCFRRAAELNPKNFIAIATLGDTLRQFGQFKEARVWLNKAKECPDAKQYSHELEQGFKDLENDEKKAQSIKGKG